MALKHVSIEAVRKLAVERQRLACVPDAPGRDDILTVFRDLGCVQVDPISAVAPSQLIVLWSRLGSFPRDVLEHLLWEERALFHYWAHAASIVLTEDYPIHRLGMRRWWRTGDDAWARRVRGWMDANAALRRSILSQLRARGPLRTSDLRTVAAVPWSSSGWTDKQTVARMLDFLWLEGKIVVAGRSARARVWDLMDRFLPPRTPRDKLPPSRIVELAAARAIRALGVATAKHIRYHFTRDRYPDLAGALNRLVGSGDVEPVRVIARDGALKRDWYVHRDDLPVLADMERERDAWSGRTVLLSPFDNLICDRDRTELLWDFDYRIEIYVPKSERRYGYYVLPILWNDRLVGRVDASVEKAAATLRVNALYAESAAPADAGRDLPAALLELSSFVGANGVSWPQAVPRVWRSSLGG